MSDGDDQDLEGLGRRIGHVVHAHRAAQGLSLGDLGRAAGLSKTILARIERGEGNPSVETLWRLSKALRLPLGALLAEEHAPRVRVVRAGKGEALRADSGMHAWLLHAAEGEHRTEVYDLRLPRGTEQETGPHLPGTQEVVVCVRGRLLVGPLGEEEELGAGDAIWFAADVGHRYVALRDAQAVGLMLYAPVGR